LFASHFAVVDSYDFFDNGEAEAGASSAAVAGFVKSGEAIEYQFSVCWCDSGSVVVNVDSKTITGDLLDTYLDSRIGVSGGVVDEVANSAGQHLYVADQRTFAATVERDWNGVRASRLVIEDGNQIDFSMRTWRGLIQPAQDEGVANEGQEVLLLRQDCL
jgi:hypothetical protein